MSARFRQSDHERPRGMIVVNCRLSLVRPDNNHCFYRAVADLMFVLYEHAHRGHSKNATQKCEEARVFRGKFSVPVFSSASTS